MVTNRGGDQGGDDQAYTVHSRWPVEDTVCLLVGRLDVDLRRCARSSAVGCDRLALSSD